MITSALLTSFDEASAVAIRIGVIGLGFIRILKNLLDSHCRDQGKFAGRKVTFVRWKLLLIRSPHIEFTAMPTSVDTMQINSTPDPEITRIQTDNQIAWAVAKKVQQSTNQQAEAIVELLQSAAEVTNQLDQNRIDVKL